MEKVVIRGFDIFDVTRFINRRKKRALASLLSKIESEIGDQETFFKIRKYILDDFNDFSRDVVSDIFGKDLNV